MAEVFVGLGSNIDPEKNLGAAIPALTAGLGRLRCSDVYRSPAFGFEGPDFLNLVVAFSSDAGPEAIDELLSAIEHAGGRVSRGGSRTLDLDLLICGAAVDAGRRLPREDVLRYPFVLAPLAELAPALRHPVTGMAIGDAWRLLAATEPPLTRLGPLQSP
jgi:2-amino-4-hydroxy-6-hydroxymethyldihydropteridine diphosphokinase